MKYGIYYAYWEKQWGGDFRPYVERVKRLGFDLLEIAAADLLRTGERELDELKELAIKHNITLTAGYGPSPQNCVSAADASAVDKALEFYKNTFKILSKLDIHMIGGGLYSYWPVDFSKPFDKAADWKRAVEGIKKMADIASDYDITLGMEALNRFEGYLLNTSAEACAFIDEVNKPNVKVMLDTFHMNIEEDSFGAAIRQAGNRLGHFHLGECNRKVPGQGRMPWREIGEALRDVNYDGAVVMEPFVLMGGKVGEDIKIWRDLNDGSDATLDRDAANSVAFMRFMLEGQ